MQSMQWDAYTTNGANNATGWMGTANSDGQIGMAPWDAWPTEYGPGPQYASTDPHSPVLTMPPESFPSPAVNQLFGAPHSFNFSLPPPPVPGFYMPPTYPPYVANDHYRSINSNPTSFVSAGNTLSTADLALFVGMSEVAREVEAEAKTGEARSCRMYSCLCSRYPLPMVSAVAGTASDLSCILISCLSGVHPSYKRFLGVFTCTCVTSFDAQRRRWDGKLSPSIMGLTKTKQLTWHPTNPPKRKEYYPRPSLSLSKAARN
ncbi:hypothetical protein B0H13DRAFT_1875064 [Mycena leptocephala]|nr:hypothetical protein B0H13DRAFT_1875064 [Mycena leptocephala]